MPEIPPDPVTVAMIEELQRLARQLSPEDEPALVFSA
jgi:hypothetical protein